MANGVLHSTSVHKVNKHTTTQDSRKAISPWEVSNLLSTKDTKQYKFLSEVYIPGRTATNQQKDAVLLKDYQKNITLFHQNLYEKAAMLETTFGYATQNRTKLFFIHTICDAAHTYTYAPKNTDPTLQNLANRLLDAHPTLFETASYIPKDKFLCNGTTFTSLYLRNSLGMYVVAPYGPHFGNVLFRVTPNTGDICFSPLFINYVDRNISGVPPKKFVYEELANDRHFYTRDSGFKVLTDRDAVAHYRWLTEMAPHDAFTTYLTNIGHTTTQDEYTFQERKDLLAKLSKQYFCLGQGVTVERMPATIFPSPTKAQMPRPPILQDTSTSPMKQNTRSLGTDRRSPNSLGITSSDSHGSSDDEHVGSRKRSLSDGALHTQNAGWEHVRGSQKIINIHKHYHYHGASRSNTPTLPLTQNSLHASAHIPEALPRAEAAYPKRRYHPPIQTALHASHAAWKHPHQHYIPQAVHIPSVTPKPVYLDVTPVKNCYYWIPADEPKVAKSFSYKFLSFCSKVVNTLRYS